jgi:hypothetical protein
MLNKGKPLQHGACYKSTNLELWGLTKDQNKHVKELRL